MNTAQILIAIALAVSGVALLLHRPLKRHVFTRLGFALLTSVSVPVLLLTGGCASSVQRAAVDTVTAGGGAALGASIAPDGKKTVGAALGGAAGLVLGELYNYSQDKELQKAYLTGYEKGRSDAVKTLYWVTKDMNTPSEANQSTTTLREVPIPQHKASDGTVIRPTTEVIEVVNP